VGGRFYGGFLTIFGAKSSILGKKFEKKVNYFAFLWNINGLRRQLFLDICPRIWDHDPVNN